MRTPCRACGGLDGYVERKANNDVVRCAGCETFAYCAPRVELGLPSENAKARRLESKFPGRCTACDAAYGVGMYIWWTRGMQGARCDACGGAG